MEPSGDLYFSTIFLSISIFSFALDYKGNVNCMLANLGSKYTTGIYIIYVIILACCNVVASKLGLSLLLNYIGPVVVFLISLLVCFIFGKLVLIISNRKNIMFNSYTL